MPHLYLLLLILVASIAFIVLMTARARVNAFFVLIIAAIGVGLSAGLDATDLLTTIKSGFGHLLEAIGLIVILGTVLGVILEKTGATGSLADFILARAGEKKAPLAIGMTGFLVGLPIFCDSGFVVLSGLNKSLAFRTGTPMAVMAVSLAAGLYSVHCLVPPHPGITAAAGLIGVDTGLLMLTGTLVALPGAYVGYRWAIFKGSKYASPVAEGDRVEKTSAEVRLPSPWRSGLPIALPIVLIALKAVSGQLFTSEATSHWMALVGFVGDPVVALLAGIGVALTLVRNWDKALVNQMLTEGVDKAGPVLAIVAAGGAFGAVLKATAVGDSLGQVLSPLHLGIFLPFVIAAILKTVQGSSTVAVITTASMIGSLFSELGLDSHWGRLLGTLSMGAGSMLVSHANDAFFWVVARFSNLEPHVAFRVYSTATLWMGLVTQVIVFGLSLLLL